MKLLPWMFVLIRCLLPKKHRAELFPRLDRGPDHDSRVWSIDSIRSDQRQLTRK